MGLFDQLKSQVQQAGNQMLGEAGQQLKNAVGGANNFGCKKVATVTFQNFPVNLEQLKAMPEAALTKPEETAALTVAVLCLYPVEPEAAFEMLNFLSGPKELGVPDKQRLVDRFRGKPYVANSYFAGATVDNNYEPTQPYQITLMENSHSRDTLNEGYLALFIQSAGADSPRPITLRNKPSTGQWFVYDYQSLLVDIRIPKAADPWA